MINEDVFGLKETVRPSLSYDETKVYLNKTLRRPPGDAAIPPGQSMELLFYSMGDAFDIIVLGVKPYIRTDERRNGSLLSAIRPEMRPRTHGHIGSSIDGWVAEAHLPPAVFRARLPFDGPGLGGGWELAPPGDIAPPPEPVDPVVPFEVTITGPRGDEQTFVEPLASELKDLPWRGAFRSAAANEAAHGLWKVSVLNTNDIAMRVDLTVRAVHSVLEHQHVDLPLSLINNLGATVLKKTMATIAYHDGALVVETPTHFLGLFGVATEISLPSIVGDLIKDVPTFSPVLAVVESRLRFLRRLNDRKRLLSELLAPDPWADEDTRDHQDRRRERVLEDIQEEIDRVERLRPDQATFCIVIEGIFSEASVDLAFIGRIAEVENKLPQIAFILDSHFEVTEVVSTVSIDLSPLFAKEAATVGALALLSGAAVATIFGPIGGLIAGGLVVLGGFKLFNSINIDAEAELRDALSDMGPPVSQYARSIIERLSGFSAIAMSCALVSRAAADRSDVLRVSFCDPSTARGPRPFDLPGLDDIADLAGVTAQFRAHSARALTIEAPGGRVTPRTRGSSVAFRSVGDGTVRRVEHALKEEPAGPLPAGFEVEEKQSLSILDRHDTIVLVMMENRSFDHYFFELSRSFPGRGYDDPPIFFTNPPPHGFGEPMKFSKNDDIGIGNTLIFQHPFHSLDPSHSLDHTMFQIGGGTTESAGSGQMQGFARDFALKSDSPHIVMSYFGLDSLPTYRALADQYAICTRWFASLPVGTQPNRLSALQGDVPFLYNLHMDDPSLGYLEDYSIFDLCTSQGITWKFFEGDIGTIRLYDRYRLDVENVRPLSDLRRTLRTARDTGQLPRLIIIEPEFLFGNDDHPPMDVRDGQEFVRDVIGQFIDFGMLDRALFIITYDEHGGFGDHVPPPGTPAGDPAWLGQVADMFPQDPDAAPDCMGVRVPAMVLSKFISPEAKTVVLDHTSILKTILLHNRQRISTGQFSRFGERVMRGAHLGQVLDLNVARIIDYADLAQTMDYVSADSWFGRRALRLVDGSSTGGDPTHAGRLLHNIAAPRARRFVSGRNTE